MATLFVQCPSCHHRLELDTGFAGGVCRCSHCGTLMKVPRRTDQSPQPVNEVARPASPGDSRPEAPIAADTASSAVPDDSPDAALDTVASQPRADEPTPAPAPREGQRSRPAASTTANAGSSSDPAQREERPGALRRNQSTRQWRDPTEAKTEKPPRRNDLQYYLGALVRHYGTRTPADLSPKNLPIHARYLEHRHQRIAGRLARLLDPERSSHKQAQALAQNNPTWREALHVACESRQAIIQEVGVCGQYWSHVVRDGRLPSRLAMKLVRYNRRPIAHPWTSVDAWVLERLGELDVALNDPSFGQTDGQRSSTPKETAPEETAPEETAPDEAAGGKRT